MNRFNSLTNKMTSYTFSYYIYFLVVLATQSFDTLCVTSIRVRDKLIADSNPYYTFLFYKSCYIATAQRLFPGINYNETYTTY